MILNNCARIFDQDDFPAPKYRELANYSGAYYIISNPWTTLFWQVSHETVPGKTSNFVPRAFPPLRERPWGWGSLRAITIRPKISGRISGNFYEQMVQSFSSVEDDNCSLGIFKCLLGLNYQFRSKQNTEKSTSWLFIDHNSRDLAQTTTAAKMSQNKGFNESSMVLPAL